MPKSFFLIDTDKFAIVPKEPTPEMTESYVDSCFHRNIAGVAGITPGYKAMLSAAPQPEPVKVPTREVLARLSVELEEAAEELLGDGNPEYANAVMRAKAILALFPEVGE